MNSILDQINSVDDLKQLPVEKLPILAEEVRKFIIEVVSENGGHLAPNLGAVDFTIALHRVFDSPTDKIIWDVGHQSYTHKILTGRKEFFKTLRKYKGCSGFPSPTESAHDPFIAGHAGTAISVALGFAKARDLNRTDENIIAVIGDGSLTCGTTLEGLNNVSSITKKLIIILNDNKMSISKNVGAISKSLNRLISTHGYNKLKSFSKDILLKFPGIGKQIIKAIGRIEEAIKSIIVPGVFFEELGIRYIGPVNGHDIPEMIRTFNAVKEFETPVIIHLITEKGKGYRHAEKMPEKFHGLSPFDLESGKINGKFSISFSSVCGNELCKLAEKQKEVIAITAAMKTGTGLTEFAEKYPDRFFDVGIAEEHAVVFAASLAKTGYRPFVAIYATFLQRALDYIYHDVCLQNLPVIFCVDRAGVVEDGPTHHGIYDISFLRALPNISILSPKDDCEFRKMIIAAYTQKNPCVIRYPRGDASDFGETPEISWGKAQILKDGADISIWASGRESLTALKVSEILSEKGIKAKVVNARFLKPFDKELLLSDSQFKLIVTIEDNSSSGGLTSISREILSENTKKAKIINFYWPDKIIEHGNIEELKSEYKLSAEKIAENIEKNL
ncbi:MAG TPA: 1-deoxy-D-xylulose-5-phosphate synthase [Victivallales bacterium]|nr:1-deoxy-D-xylulose-5-phosphate synthase [Victivallales bacterium]HPO89591.1 1-deoxy-D-xylulose-5-phosphate synthase [Victivallales bacterium]